MQIIGRAHGRSAIAAAAYRSGQRLVDEGRGVVADFSRRQGVVHAEILAPAGCASWLSDRQSLWNGVERHEKRSDAQLAREFNVALPHELSDAERLDLVRAFVSRHFVQCGMVADIAIHRPVAAKGDDPRNHHAHVMLTLRRATPQGLDPVKTREWNSAELLREWRRQWAEHCNALLDDRALQHVRIDHRTLAVQRDSARQAGDHVAATALDRLPELHIGPRALAAGRRGRELVSRDRPGRRPRAGQGRWQARSRPRIIHYPLIDKGSRYSVNLRRISQNLEKLDRQIIRYQTGAARARLRGFGSRYAAGRVRPRRRQTLAALIRQLDGIITGLFAFRQQRLRRRNALLHLLDRRPGRGVSHRPGRRRSRTWSGL